MGRVCDVSPGQMKTHVGELRLDSTVLEELQDQRPVVTLSRAEVSSIGLEWGFTSERLVLEAMLSGGVVAFGVALAWVVLGWYRHGGTMEIHVIAAAASTVPLGLFMLFRSLRRGQTVVVTLRDGTRRTLVLGRAPSLAAQFTAVAREFGWPISDA